jgi:hypothetical protein
MQLKKLSDPLNDSIGKLLQKFNEINTWTEEKHKLSAELSRLVEAESYLKFVADGNVIGLSSVGASCLFDIPATQRGNLAIFKGQKIRVICMSNHKYSKFNYAGIAINQENSR